VDVFVGFDYEKNKENELLRTSRSGVSAASNQYQTGFLSGLPEAVEIFSTLSTGAFPRGNKRLWFARENSQTNFGKITYLPFVNFYFVKEFMFERELHRELSMLIDKQEYTTVYVYSLYLPYLKVMERLKKEYGEKLHYCLIVPDLPGKYGIVRRGIKGIKDRLDVRKKMSLPNCADSFVFLT